MFFSENERFSLNRATTPMASLGVSGFLYPFSFPTLLHFKKRPRKKHLVEQSSETICGIRRNASRSRRSRIELLKTLQARVLFPAAASWELAQPVDHALDRWISRQRSLWREGLLTREEYQELQNAGLDAVSTAGGWTRKYRKIKDFLNALNLSPAKIENEPYSTLQEKVSRMFGATGVEILKSMLESRQHGVGGWDNSFNELKNVVGRQESANVSSLDKSLTKWVSRQRTQWKKGELSEDRYRRLSAIGFLWDLQYERWKKFFYKLVEFKETFGHCNVTSSLECEGFEALAKWVVRQRHQYRRGTLNDDRRRRLEGIGFCFDPWSETFAKQLIVLQEYFNEHGHANVPCGHGDLTSFTACVRRRYEKGKLSINHYRQLRKLNFEFSQPCKSFKRKQSPRDTPISTYLI